MIASCKPGKRLRNWHITHCNANISLKEFARALLAESDDFELMFGKPAGSVAPIAKRWLASKKCGVTP